MYVIGYLAMTVISAVQIKGTNLLLNKPSVQSSTYVYSGVTYGSGNANDGRKTGDPAITEYLTEQAYWQGDLQGIYIVRNIRVTSVHYGSWANEMKNATIGVSVHEANYSEDEMTRCGQWPDAFLIGHTKVFNCNHAGPARFVTIWREFSTSFNLGRSRLSVAEVEVEGDPSTLTAPKIKSCGKSIYKKISQQKVISPTTTLSARSAISCAVMCSLTQPCVVFSFRSYGRPNCLLASDVTMTSHVNWDSYMCL